MTDRIELPTIESKTIEIANIGEFADKPAKIEKIELVELDSPFGLDGKPLPAGQTIKTKAIKVVSEKLGIAKDKEGNEITDSEGNPVEIRATELLNLAFDEEKGWGIPTGENSNIQKFMKKLKITDINDAVGKSLVTKERESKRNPSIKFLGFYYK